MGDEESISRRNKMSGIDGSEASPDRLSELPEPLLVQILSLLPMKDAVRTDVLSKRWKNLWNHVDKLVYRHDDIDHGEFTCFVSGTLKRCTSPNIKKLSLRYPHNYYYPNQLDEWLQWAYSRKVETLEVESWRYVHSPPDWFYVNSSLLELDISAWDLSDLGDRGPFLSWASLRSLSLRCVIMNVGIEEILLGCPMLEKLVLEDILIRRLDIVAPRLQSLTLIGFYGDSLLKINAPWIRCLEISNDIGTDELQLINIASLVEATLTFVHENHYFCKGKVDSLILDLATGLLERVCHIEVLTLGAELIQALSILKLLGKPCPLFKCKHLTINLRVMRYELPGIMNLLQNSPQLETLVMEIEIPSFWERDFGRYLNGIIKFDDEAAYLTTEKVDLPQLTRMKIAHRGNVCSPNFGIELAEYIVSNADDLEELAITYANFYDSCRCSRNCVSRYESLLSLDQCIS